MTRIHIPPIKCQGIKSKLVPWIRDIVQWNDRGRWIEPFVGSGVVGFNIAPHHALFCDSNPHIIAFYAALNTGELTPGQVKTYLVSEGKKLAHYGKAYYYEVRERFNTTYQPLDFLVLNRSCFNGVIRFNSQGKFNVPFGHKVERFSKAYITKIVNQVEVVYKQAQLSQWTFLCQDFRQTLADIHPDDVVYCDPPYAGRHVDYYNGWTESDESALCTLLKQCAGKFLLSTWHHNQYRGNPYITTLWTEFHMFTREHFYHVGAKETNRNPVIEAIITNFIPRQLQATPSEMKYEQLLLLEREMEYAVNVR
ncbi:DNA adenine methylase [Candidatus Vecturithrix granuli]|uniref:Site-specific DNA-methyltransferase (adenine-specific) n=1 Tax=Vecturithrix granuli TaxID=1499967 RepID=A0A081C4V9_VECG1|nr:DNA adenine methylase [Candidatus Vecturithrix granuli]